MTRPGRPDDPGEGDRDPDWPRVSARLAALHGRSGLVRKRRWNSKVWIVSTVLAVVVLAGAFAVVAVHYNRTVLNVSTCPSLTSVNARLGTTLDMVSGISLSDLRTCSYAQGPDTKALSIDVADSNRPAATGGDLCTKYKKRTLTVRGHKACSLSGTPGTTPGRPSLFVAANNGDWQFTTNLSSVSMVQLEALAAVLLAPGRSPLA